MSDREFEKVGELSEVVVRLLGLVYLPGTPVYIGHSNIEHMKSSHSHDFDRFHSRIPEIIFSPSLIGLNIKDGSIEFISRFPGLRDSRNYIKLAVRASSDGFLFARSLYEVSGTTIQNRLKAGNLKRLTSS